MVELAARVVQGTGAAPIAPSARALLMMRFGSNPKELVREHTAVRRVATLVARAPAPPEVFAAVTEEAAVLLAAQRANLLRVASPEWAEVVAAWSDGTAPPVPVGHRGRSTVAGSSAGCCRPRRRYESRTSTRWAVSWPP